MASQMASLRLQAVEAMAQPAAPAGIFDNMDHASSALILELQIQDINQLLGAKNDEAELSGWQETLLAQKEELQRSLSIIRDRRVGLHISHAMAREYFSI